MSDRFLPSTAHVQRPHVREILFVTGEASGDLHGAGVAEALAAVRAPFRLVGIGGDGMRAAGVELIEHSARLAVMGLIEPLKLLPRFYRLRRILRERIQNGNVALVVLIDFGGFNLAVASVASDAGVPVLYYITPQVWASRANRLRTLARTVTRAAVILPFEEKLLRAHGIDATFVGHPLLDRAATLPNRDVARASLNIGRDDRLLVLFPGSRSQEVIRHLDPFVAAARELQRRHPRLTVVVSAAPHVAIPVDRCPYPVMREASRHLLCAADAAICKSGTTTLEAAIALCPMIVAYRTSTIEYWLARAIVKIPFIGLVNIVAGRRVVAEFVQGDLVPTRLADALDPLLNPYSPVRAEMVHQLASVRDMLGRPGAATRVAEMAVELASGT